MFGQELQVIRVTNERRAGSPLNNIKQLRSVVRLRFFNTNWRSAPSLIILWHYFKWVVLSQVNKQRNQVELPNEERVAVFFEMWNSHSHLILLVESLTVVDGYRWLAVTGSKSVVENKVRWKEWKATTATRLSIRHTASSAVNKDPNRTVSNSSC